MKVEDIISGTVTDFIRDNGGQYVNKMNVDQIKEYRRTIPIFDPLHDIAESIEVIMKIITEKDNEKI
jgi:hypothetical protein